MVPPPDYEIDPQADFASEKVEAIRAGQSTPTELSLAEMELQVEIIGNLGSYTLSGLSSTYFDQNGFINANGAGWNEMMPGSSGCGPSARRGNRSAGRWG